MTLSITQTGNDTVLDETAGLQNDFTSDLVGDLEDNDTALDLPGEFSTRLTAVGETSFLGAALTGYDGSNFGLNAFTITDDGGGVDDLGLTQAGGVPFPTYDGGDPADGIDSGLEAVDGGTIYLFQDVTTNNIVYGVDTDGDIVLAVYLDEATDLLSGKLWSVQTEAIVNPLSPNNFDEPVDLTDKLFVTASRDLEFDVENAPAGQSLHITFSTGENPLPADNVAIIVTGETPPNTSEGESLSDTDRDSVNTRSGTSFGTNSQGVVPDDSLWFTFVMGSTSDFTVPNLDQNEADVELTIQFNEFFGAVGARFVIEQMVSGKTAAIRLTAVDEEALAADASEDNFVDELLDGGDPVDVDRIVIEGTRKVNGPAPDNDFRIIITDSGIVVDQGSDPGITATFHDDGSVSIFDVAQGDIVEYTTDGTHERINIANIGDGSGQDSGTIDIGSFQLIQGDMISVEIGSTVNFEDDGPSFGTQGTIPDLTVDETVFATDAGPTSFAGVFTPLFGTDGFQDADDNNVIDEDAVTYALGVSEANAVSGLVDTLTGDAVLLNLVGGVVIGTVNGGTDEVFRITVVANTGDVTLDQSRSVVHDNPADPDESTSPAMLSAATLVTLTATATDGDLDIATDTANIGLAFNFEDDGPSFGTQGTIPDLTVDETVFATDAGPTSFAGVFTPLFGTDGFQDADDNNVIDEDAVTYALGVSEANAVSGLVDTLTGDAVLLNLVGGVVIGTVNGGTDEVFRITVVANTGDVTLDQSRSVVHDNPADPDESTSPAMLSAATLVTLTATATDGDLDIATDTANIGLAFNFEDDGPSFGTQGTIPDLTVDETVFATDAGPTSFAGVFTPLFGTDGFQDADDNNVIDEDAVTYALGVSEANADSGLVDTLTGDAVLLNLVGGVVIGTVNGGTDEVFRITVVANTGDVTLDQSRSVVHDNPADPDENTSPAMLSAATLVTLTATATDGDLDIATDTANIGLAFNFEDDGPSFGTQGTIPDLTVDETVFATDAGPTSFAGVFTPLFGTDGFQDADDNNVIDEDAVTYALGVSEANAVSGLVDTLTGDAVLLNLVGGVVIGTVNGGTDEVFRITVVANTGDVTLDQSRSVVHDNPADPDESTSPAMLSAATLVTLTATATDGDLDIATDTANIGLAFNFEDDGPSFGTQGTIPDLTVDETVFATDAGPTSFAGVFTPLFGTDGFQDADDNNVIDEDAVTYALGVSEANADSGLVDTLTGDAVLLNLVGGVVIGTVNGGTDEVFRITVVANTGDVTLDQSRSVVHDNPADPDENTSPAMLSAATLVTLTATATDGDLDIATDTANIGLAFNFEDDGPVVTVEDLEGTFAPDVQGPGDWFDGPGADGFKSLNINLDNYTLGANSTVNIDDDLGTLTTPDVNGDFVFMGSITDDFNDDGATETVQFQLSFNPATDMYDFELIAPPSSTVEISSADGSLDAGGPDPVRTLTVDSTDIVFSAVKPLADPNAIKDDLDQGEAHIEANASYLSTDEMNVSTAGIGNDNNNFNGNANSGVDGDTTNGGKTDESFVVDPDSDISSMKVFIDNSVSGYDTNTEELYYRVYYNDGTFDPTLTKVVSGDLTAEAGGQVSFVVGDPMGESNIDAVQIFMGTGTVKIPVIEFTITEEFNPEPLDMVFTATLVDNDDDSNTDMFSIDLDPGVA